MKNNLIVKKNPLVNARYKLSPLEIKIVFSVISMIEKDDSDFWTYQVKIDHLDSDYRNIQRVCRGLMTKVFEIKEDDGWLMLNWFSHIRYKQKERVIECAFDPNLKPYLLHIKDNFTAYTLSSVLSMASTYSIRLYELLKEYEGLGARTFNLDDLQDILQLPKSYRVWRDFKKRVLESAEKDINADTDINISYNFVKSGRKITAISFVIDPKIKKLTLNQYIAHLRSNFVNKTLLCFKDKERDKEVELSVSEKGYLYDKLDVHNKITATRAAELWEYLYKNQQKD